ncbi:hypothetical protein [Shouchella shacheensis]|nr:hypothetical protein [Shouchella shacheensis]
MDAKAETALSYIMLGAVADMIGYCGITGCLVESLLLVNV